MCKSGPGGAREADGAENRIPSANGGVGAVTGAPASGGRGATTRNGTAAATAAAAAAVHQAEEAESAATAACVAAEGVRTEAARYNKELTETLIALFSLLTLQQLQTIEGENSSLNDNETLKKCVQEGKSAAALAEHNSFRNVVRRRRGRGETAASNEVAANSTQAVENVPANSPTTPRTRGQGATNEREGNEEQQGSGPGNEGVEEEEEETAAARAIRE